ncbi:type II toxin-antitoxin system death-on-curing family toxin [Deinococcus roseus]|uniref:Death-on-curing protein n=1 Tax=Deinococcus roseus TaxID=392414 RepID=A0ABQ2D2A5_9DEIO|nr:type II toxin-antitoxin system death-on-curing family toxin [Deinococcus roseus]GGJ37720.1 death-on-curing protein [Deinococcus roseus]
MIPLSLDQVLHLHDLNIKHFGGSSGVRDQGLLESALAQPFLSAFGEERYVGLFQKAAAYWYFLARNHPFIDGNKRTALTTALVFLQMHGIKIQTSKTLEDTAVEVATGAHSMEAMASLLEVWQK